MNINLRTRFLLISAAVSALIFTGCFENSHSHDDEESPLMEACEHIGETGTDITGSAAIADAPDVSKPHTPYSVRLIDVVGGKGGMVKFEAKESTDYVFFLSKAVPVKALDATGGEIAIEETIVSGIECAGIKSYHTIPLTKGASYLELGPTDESQVKLVIEKGSHNDH